MKLVGLLVFYDESPSWLAACTASLCRLCDHIVAVDGAYLLYPQARPHTGPDPASEIIGVCLTLGVGVTYHAPQTVWAGNEIGKRNLAFELAKTVAGPDDWLVVVDADMLITDIPADLRDQLAATDADVGSYRLVTREDWLATDAQAQVARDVAVPPGEMPIRLLFRARRSLRIEQAHFGYVIDTDDGPLFLWSPAASERTIDTGLVVEHRRQSRTRHRLEQAAAYNQARDSHRLEQDPLATVGQHL
jgi:hypothetical protein